MRQRLCIDTHYRGVATRECEAIAGVIVGSRKASGAYGSGTQALLQNVEGKQWAIWLTSWFWLKICALQNAERGDICRIVFLGQKKSGFNKTFNAYDLRLRNPMVKVKLALAGICVCCGQPMPPLNQGR